jgi:poly(ADP-ribose) glycohydrolase ARH3
MLHARAVAKLLSLDLDSFDPVAFVEALAASIGDDPVFRKKLAIARELLSATNPLGDAVERIGNGVTADEAVPLAVLAFVRSPASYENAVTEAVRCGGDTDTIAAMTGALSGALLGAERLPIAWLSRLENDARGRDYIVSLADGVCGCATRRES